MTLRARAMTLAVLLTACGPVDADDADGGENTGDSGTPTEVRLALNEVMPANAAACADEQGEFDDWIELANPGDTALDLTGYRLTDDPAVPAKAVLASGVSIPAHGFLTLWADDDTKQGPTHLPFKLAAAAETVVLSTPDGTEIDRFSWVQALDDLSYARVPDVTGDFHVCAVPTCGAANSTTCDR